MYKPARSRRVVQKPPAATAAIAPCTNLSIDKSVQVELVRKMQIGEFRKGMKAALEGEQAVILGSSWRPRGIILPVRDRWHYKGNRDDARRDALQRLFAAALEALDR